MKVLAIDIGISGAIACLGIGESHVSDLPLIDSGSDRWLDGRGIYDRLLALVPVDERCILVVEDVRPRSQGNGGRSLNSMGSQGSMMRSRGVIEAAASIARFSITWVQPQTWKRHYGLKRAAGEPDGAVKERGRQLALSLFPEHDQNLQFKYHHNRADALLMAHWGRSTQL
jgi:crossover junction endodeoxyribonuclease RuvC